MQATITHLTCSSLHRCLQRHGTGRLADVTGDKPAMKALKSYPIGFFHIDIAECKQLKASSTCLSQSTTSKFAFVYLAEKANRFTASAFLVKMIKVVPQDPHHSD